MRNGLQWPHFWIQEGGIEMMHAVQASVLIRLQRVLDCEWNLVSLLMKEARKIHFIRFECMDSKEIPMEI